MCFVSEGCFGLDISRVVSLLLLEVRCCGSLCVVFGVAVCFGWFRIGYIFCYFGLRVGDAGGKSFCF